ncbi:hypothetical protein AVEN_161973-1, partial [Araneus ventricosus]
SSLSSIASSQRTVSADSSSSRRNSGIVTGELHGNYFDSWIENGNHTISPELDSCLYINKLEDLIDEYQAKADDCRKSIKSNQGNRRLVKENKDFLKSYLETIADTENLLMKVGPCPIPDCSRHHNTGKDVEMAEAGQYANYPLPKSPTPPSKLSTVNAFKQVSPKKAAKPQLEKTQSPIETSNRFQNLIVSLLLKIFKNYLRPVRAAYKHSLLQLSPIATYDESHWTTECESL